MIDRQTGSLNFAPAVYVHAGDSLEAVVALALGESNDIYDMQTGWQWLSTRNVQVTPYFFALRFGFCNNSLKLISLSFSSERAEELSSWDTWSEETEMQRLAELKKWIYAELGREGHFSWGTVTANYDVKSASSGITINYN
jgi:hypothetical protein